MAEYIKKDDVLEYMRSRLDMQDEYLPIHFMDFVIDEMPAADVRENVRGTWLGKPIGGYCTVRCSICNAAFRYNRGQWSFCPECGTDMRKTCDGDSCPL